MTGLVPFNRKNTSLLGNGFEDFYNMLDDFFNDSWVSKRGPLKDSFKIDVQDTGTEYLVEAALPGVNKEEINLDLNEGTLSISVNKQENINEENKNYIHRETRSYSMGRSIYLANAKTDGIKAKLENGMLKITVPKQENEVNATKIEIE